MAKQVQELIERGKLAEREGRRDDARRMFEEALHALGSSTHASTASALLRWVGRTYHTDGDHTAALDCLEAALAVAELSGDQASAGHAMNLQAIVHWRQGELDEAEALYVRARETALVAGEQWLAAMTAQNLGVIANIRGDLERALRFYVTSLGEFRQLGSASEMCCVLNNMGKLYTDLEQWDSATRSFDEAGQIAVVLGDVGARILLEVNRGELEIARADFVAARDACLKALRLSEETGDSHVLGEVHMHLGTVSRELGEYVRAEQHFESADVLGHERKEPLLLAEIARERGELYRRQGRNREALQQLNRAHRMFTELRAKREIADLNRMTGRLERYFLEVVKHWGESIESQDKHTQGHCERVADISCALASRTGMDPNELFWFRIGATLHDVGKLIIPSEVLNKPGKLTADEWELVKRHPMAGVEMLSDVDFPGDTLQIVRSHHERWDGRGYPDALVGEAIPRSARILCIADVYDALTSRRSYKPPIPHEKAMVIMREEAGRQFDPELFAVFDELMKSPQGVGMARTSPDSRASGRFDSIEMDLGPKDDLTGLTMRRPFVDAANRILNDRHQYANITLFVIDVDEFKTVNDSHGHLQGDVVLKTIAETLRAQIGGTGMIGRYAGDEFVVLLTQVTGSEARDVATRLITAVRELKIPLRERTGTLGVTLSVGVAAPESEQRDFESLFAAADRALYEAKRRGRDTVVWAEETSAAHRDPQLHVRQFVGRKEETRRLVKLLETTLESGSAIVSVVGEAGVGKSTLVRQLAPELRLRTGSLVSGRCFETDVKRPYAPWAEALSAVNQLGVGGSQLWKELPRLVPELGAASGSAAQHKYVLFDEVVAYLRTAAASRPLVVVLDDMQWADTASWDLLEHVVASLERDRILICLTIRAEDAERAVVERMRRLSRDERYTEIALRRLNEREVAVWLDHVFAHQEIDPTILPLLQRYSEGNPFLTTQILRTLLDDKLVQFTGGRWELRSRGDIQLPAAVAGLMDRRLERLSPDTRRMLATAAVIGRVFDVDLACASGAGTEDELLDAVDEGVAHAVLETVGTGGATYSFTHSLLVNAVTASINARRLSRIHERVAVALEAHAPTRLAEIAVHYDRAGNAEKTYFFAMAAGRASVALYAHAEARTFFDLAGRCAADEGQRGTAMFRVAEVAETEGKYVEADRLCEEILEDLGPQAGVAQYLPLRRMRERIRANLGRASAETIKACQALLIEAIAMGERAEEAALLGMISHGHSRLANWEEAEAVARQAAEAARITGDSRALADALTRLGNTLLNRSPTEAFENFRQAFDLFQRLDDRAGQARVSINMGIIYGLANDTNEAERAYNRALEGARNAHASDLAGLACVNLGVLYLKRGRAELAGERFEEALQAFVAAQHEPHRLGTLLNLAHLARENGHWDKATSLYTEVIALAVHTGQPDVELGARAGFALTELALGKTAAAADQARAITARMDGRPGWWFQGREIVEALRIRIAAAHRDYGEAVSLLKENVEALQGRDLYAAGWLLGECAQALPPDRVPFSLITELSPRIEAHGYAGLALRFATLRLILNDGPRPTTGGAPLWAPTGSDYEPSDHPFETPISEDPEKPKPGRKQK
jgi:diguanylate cyclase (GGDEF)-like protein